jgi:prolyl-tRNA synthetase
MGLTFRAVAADTGAIGGDRSHEFQVIADTGEDAIVYSPASDYAANIELAEAMPSTTTRSAPNESMRNTPTPGRATCEAVASLLNIPLERTVKSLALATDEADAAGSAPKTVIWLLLVRGDHALNEVKVGKLPGLDSGFRFATGSEIERAFGCQPGYLGPMIERRTFQGRCRPHRGRDERLRLRRQRGGPPPDRCQWGRDLPEPDLVADIRNVEVGDPAPDGSGPLSIQRGIEVGHVFFLGTKYSEAMNATYLDEAGKPQLLQMGCYGIGITRFLGAAIEQNHDARGMIWSDALAPFSIVLCPIGYDRSDAVRNAADDLYGQLQSLGVDAILDDRGERPGAMFAEWELIGVPHRIVLSDRGLKEATVEYQGRRDAGATSVSLAEVRAFVKAKLDA